MASWRNWAVVSAALGAAGVTLAATGGVVALAQRFVDDLSRPGVSIDETPLAGGWEVPQAVAEPPHQCQRALTIDVPGGPLLRGEFWAQPQPAPTVVICHGYRVDRARLRPVAALEYQDGFNVLLFDFRGHGESAQVPTSGGNAEVRDLQAALVVAARQPETLPRRLFIHGFSMGAAVALLTPPSDDVAGIIADSPYARLDDILCQMMTWQLQTVSDDWAPPLRWVRVAFPALARVTCAASDLIFRLRFRHALVARPDIRMRDWAKRDQRRHQGPRGAAPQDTRPVPVLLIHALRDPFIPVDHTLRIALAAGADRMPLDLYFADSDVHCGAYGHDPARYIATLQRFVGRACAARDTLHGSPAPS